MVEPLRLAVHRSHPLAERGSIALNDAANESFVTLRRGYSLRRITDALCEAARFDPRVAFEGDDVPTLLGLVAADLGVAVVPSHHSDAAERPNVRYLQLTDPAAHRKAWPLGDQSAATSAVRQLRAFLDTRCLSPRDIRRVGRASAGSGGIGMSLVEGHGHCGDLGGVVTQVSPRSVTPASHDV